MNSNVTPAVALSPLTSRRGFYACDYATFLKLKRLNHLIEHAKHVAAAQWHYDRKTVNQGVRFEPVWRDGRKIGRRRRDGAVARPATPLPYTLVNLNTRRRASVGHDWVGELYRAARMPSAAPVEPLDVETLARVIALLATLETWKS